MEIQRINTYKDDRFPKEILLQHGAFVIDGHQICMFKIIDHYSAEIYFDQDMEILPVIKEFREYAEHITRFYDKNHNKIVEYPPISVKSLPLDQIQPSQFFVDEDKVAAVSTFIYGPEDVIIPVAYDERIGKYLSLDGHSRLYYAAVQGWETVRAFETTPGSYIYAFSIYAFSDEARRRGVFHAKDIVSLSHQAYVQQWYSFCDDFFANQ